MPVQAKRRSPRNDSRRQLLLDAAAHLFGRDGFSGTSMRDLARSAGMLPGSIYAHFPSKEDLLLAVYEEGVARIVRRVEQAVDGEHAPWRRLEAACRAHLECVLDQSDYARVMVRVQPSDVPGAAARLTALRDAYEAGFKGLIRDLDGVPPARAKFLRLTLIGAMNWAQTWYRPGDETPADIARALIALVQPSEPANGRQEP